MSTPVKMRRALPGASSTRTTGSSPGMRQILSVSTGALFSSLSGSSRPMIGTSASALCMNLDTGLLLCEIRAITPCASTRVIRAGPDLESCTRVEFLRRRSLRSQEPSGARSAIRVSTREKKASATASEQAPPATYRSDAARLLRLPCRWFCPLARALRGRTRLRGDSTVVGSRPALPSPTPSRSTRGADTDSGGAAKAGALARQGGAMQPRDVGAPCAMARPMALQKIRPSA
mmetsp:Transcript_60666/g.198549  ORF Transcript_60666/g.198549 Transcript_60666/m.198549 type:complete len:233 (+) Transcript_60666:3101-3799(+)